MSLIPALPPSFEAALRDAHSRDARARRAAAASLASPPPGQEERAKAALRRLLDDPVGAVRGAAVAGAGSLRDTEALDVILARFDDGEPVVRQLAIIAVARMGDPRAVEPLRQALSDTRPDVRFQAAVSFAELCPNEALSALRPLVEDEDPEVRASAASAIGTLTQEGAADVIAPLLSDATAHTRADAALALAALGDSRAGPVLLEALDDPERRFAAAAALGEIGYGEAVEALARITSRLLAPLSLKAAAGAALARMGDPRGASALRGVLRALRGDGRSYAAELAGELGLVELAPDIAALVESPRGADPVVIARALADLAPRSDEARAALEKVLRGDDAEAVAVAKAALGSIDEGACEES